MAGLKLRYEVERLMVVKGYNLMYEAKTKDEVRKMFDEGVEHSIMKVYIEKISVNEPKHAANASNLNEKCVNKEVEFVHAINVNEITVSEAVAKAGNAHEMNEESIMEVNMHYRTNERSPLDIVNELSED
ncbi:hypothetical protein GH714_003883 [Hevea brasiliensis]|uniref:Uncharacterized protein n=1 Tax=Hevea brasiliensis TaxID=3981 RepID=A0A6A6NFL3_HEVBR|nr:hypothetical protein GH714_003883 [Hevea brasiliensis]